MRLNEHGQQIGPALPDWVPPHLLGPLTLVGRFVELEPLNLGHADELCAATAGPGREALWTYLSEPMPADHAAFVSYVERRVARPGEISLAIRRRGGPVEGAASWMRLDPANGSVEVGNICLGTPLQRTTAATEAMALMAAHAFATGYRRYEWKCDALNAPSRAAARRLGFTYEGTHRNAVVTKGRSRDTAWFSITDREWAVLAPAYDAWLAPGNFEDPETGEGQRTSLSSLTGEALRAIRNHAG